MTNELKRFLKKVNEDGELLEKMNGLQKETDRAKVVEKTVAIAREAGFYLTEADFEASEGEMDDLEMQAVSGGWRECICVAGGGGKEDAQGDVCACVVAGGGFRKDNGNSRCFCLVAGEGYDGRSFECTTNGMPPIV